MPRHHARRELWIVNPRARVKTTNNNKKTTVLRATLCSPPSVFSRPKVPSLFRDQEGQAGKMPVKSRMKASQSLNQEESSSSDSVVVEEDVITIISSGEEKEENMITIISSGEEEEEVKLPMPQVKRGRGRPRKLVNDNMTSKMKKSKNTQKAKKKKEKIKKNLKVSKKTTEVEQLQETPVEPKIEVSEDSENEDFEKNMKHDINYVLAKFVVDKKVGFNIHEDKKVKVSNFRKKMMSAIRRADILKLRSTLEGETIHFPVNFPIPKPSRPTAAAAASTVSRCSSPSSPVGLSSQNSPDTTVDQPAFYDLNPNLPHMPVLRDDGPSPPVSVVRSPGKLKDKIKSSKQKTRLKPINLFPPLTKTSFKIPRKEKKDQKPPRWVVNGSLWKWALTVGDDGQVSRVGKKIEKVPWAKDVQKRPCEVFESWLIRGDFEEGDDCDWLESIRKEKLLNKWRRRAEIEQQMEFERRTAEQLQGRAEFSPSSLELEEGLGWESPRMEVVEDSLGWGPPGPEEDTTGWGSPDGGPEEDIQDWESDDSRHSVQTHIRTPPHITVEDEEELWEAMTPERGQEGLVNKIPTPPPSLAAASRRLEVMEVNRFGESQDLGQERQNREGGRSGSLLSLSNIIRTEKKRLKL